MLPKIWRFTNISGDHLTRTCDFIQNRKNETSGTTKLDYWTNSKICWSQKVHGKESKIIIEKYKGLFCEPDQRKRKGMSEERSKELLKCFISMINVLKCALEKRMCIDKKRRPKRTKQKWLLLVNLKEIHLEFLKIGQPIGFSKFFQLHPKWCITITVVSFFGVHSVCVCKYHQN